MSNDQSSRRATGVSAASPTSIPSAPPLPAPQPLQRARDAAYRIIGFASQPSRPSSPVIRGPGAGRSAILGAQNATASHKTGLEINTIAISESGTHALVGGKEIFKTIRVQDGSCAEDLNLRTAIRSTPFHASGKPRQQYSIDIADVAWAKGDCGNYVAAATSSGKIILYDLGHAGLQAAQLHEHYRQVHRVTFNPHRGNLLLSGSQDGTVRLWDVRDARNQASTLQSKRKYSGQGDGVRDVKWSLTDGVDFAFGTDSGDIQRWDIRNLKAAKVKIPAHALACNTIDWHPDGKHILSASLDKTVRVWDFSTDRRQKPACEIKTPYPVMNARWRPSCETLLPNNKAARQCTQIVSSYTRDHPVVHIWDFRRSALPFREMSPYPSAPTDLIWHSQDLLWTVGREGIFLQSDVQHASKVIDRRNLQSFAVSSQGDVKFVVQKRRQRRVPTHRTPPSFTSNTSSGLSTSPEDVVSHRSWTDDSLDHSFLSHHSPSEQHSHSHGNAKMAQSGSSQSAVILLDDILNDGYSFQPTQYGGMGRLPFLQDPSVFAVLAENYIGSIEIKAEITEDFINTTQQAFTANELNARAAGQQRLAQSWKIIGFVAVERLKERMKYKREVVDHGAQLQNDNKLRDVVSRTLASTVQSPASMKSVSLITQQLDAHVSTSNVPTPLARPALSLEPDETLTLPPSLAPTTSPVEPRTLEPLHFLPDVSAVDLEENKPFSLLALLQKMKDETLATGDAQTASHLLTLIGPLLPQTHQLPAVEAEMHRAHYAETYGNLGYAPAEVAHLLETHIEPLILAGLRPLEVECIHSTYHDQLLARRCHVAAASLRKFAYPAFPAVYEDFVKDNVVCFKCGGCGKAMGMGMERLRCESCGAKQDHCPICWCNDSPLGGGRVMFHCQRCDHGGHAACMKEWFADEEGGGACPTDGCLCVCAKQ